MKIRSPHNANQQPAFAFYVWWLTGFFLLLEISFFIQCNRIYLGDFTFVTHHLQIPSRILFAVAGFVCAQLLIHMAYVLLVWWVVFAILECFQDLKAHSGAVAIGVWSTGMLTILLANQYYFPNSKFAALTAVFFAKPIILTNVFYLFLSICLLLVIPLIKYVLTCLSQRLLYVLVLSALSVSGFAYWQQAGTLVAQIPNSAPALPNIILIGVDSLRPDFLSFFSGASSTPFLDKFLAQATVFTEAVTPLARTFPSWTGILTGRYPKEIGIRSNLADFQAIDLSDSLANILQQQGYHTIYATDETRFSNIDQRFGFAQMITPPIGLADFLIGTFNDFPLTNILINTRLGEWLFPYSYSNRAVFHTYNPDTFLSLIQRNLALRQSKPLFLAVHFCLPHYPYLWSGLPLATTTVWQRYQLSVERVDRQIQAMIVMLENKKLLRHALLILLSDHGEALELNGDRITSAASFYSTPLSRQMPKFYPPSLDSEEVDQSAGHGTDVLGLPQYHSLLAFRFYDEKVKQKAELVTGVVSLLDIKPTILRYLNHYKAISYRASGQSLLSRIMGEVNTLTEKPTHVFLESDYSPQAIRTVYPETRSVLLEGIALFQINPTSTRLTVKKEMAEMIIRSKQYADIYQNWMLALYPQEQNLRMPILVNLQTGAWTNDLQSELARHSPALEMYYALQQFYGTELAYFN